MKNLMQSKNSIIYYNCAYNFHIILTLFAIVVNILLGKKTEAKVLFSDMEVLQILYQKNI